MPNCSVPLDVLSGSKQIYYNIITQIHKCCLRLWMKCKFNLLSPECINSEVTKQTSTPNCKCAQLTSVVETQHYVQSL